MKSVAAQGSVALCLLIPALTAAQTPVKLDSVITIGTRTTDRTATKSAVPVDVITSASMQATGLVETWQILQRLVPSVNVPHIPLGDDHVRPVTLRGLSPDHVLVLVDGKRRHRSAIVQISNPVLNGSSAVDLNAIPSSAVDRIEVLRDGAAAQYGSDAIAGVVNIVLKSGEARHGRATLGQVYSSEGGRDFRDGRILNVSALYGIQSRSGSQITLSADIRDRESTNRAYPDKRTQYFAGDPRNALPHVISSAEGDGEARDVSFLLNAGLPMRGGIELYALANGMHRDAETRSAAFRPASDERTVRSLHPDGFLPRIGNEGLDYSAVAGARRTMGRWKWDLSSVFGGNSVRYTLHNTNNVTLGNSSPTDFKAGRLGTRQSTTNLDLSRSLKVARRIPLDVALGTELRFDSYSIKAGEPDAYRDGGVPILDGPLAGRPGVIGAPGFFAFRPVDEVSRHRRNVAGYIELNSRVARPLMLSVAARAENYSDYGSTSIGKIAARWEPVRGIAFRSSAGTGFKAPSLAQSWISTTRSIRRQVNGVNTTLDVRIVPVSSPEARILGATALRPETSTSLSAGMVLDIRRYPTLTIDYYGVDIDDRIALTSEFSDTSIARLFADNGQRGIAGARYFSNAIDTRTRGIDIVTSYGLSVGSSGLLRLTAGYNATRTRVTHVAQAPLPLSKFRSLLFSRVEEGKMESGQPRRTAVTTLNFSFKRLALNLHNQRFGEASLLDAADPSSDQTVRAKWITDAGFSYQTGTRWSLAFSVNNLFDVYPDDWWDFKDGVNATGMSSQGIFRYPGGISPFGMNGRTVFLHLSYR